MSKACSEFMHSQEVSLTPWHQLQVGSTSYNRTLLADGGEAVTGICHCTTQKEKYVNNFG